jgi:putative aldouronate transport system substrate-binding protein
MKGNRKRLYVFMIVGTFFLSSCASGGVAANTETTPQSLENDSGAAVVDGPLSPFPETVTVKVVKEFDPDTWFPDGESFSKNILTDYYQEQLNIKYELVQEIERGQYESKINLMIASNDLPDVFYANASQIYRMATAGQILDQQEVYDKYASDKVKQELNINNMMLFTPASYEGGLYGIPCPEDFSITVPMIWVRQDWLDELGITFDPKTNEDVYDLARQFIEKGKVRYGFIMDDGTLPNLNIFNAALRALGHSESIPINIFVDDGGGQLIYSDVQPVMKDFLKELNSLYNEGIIDKEFATKSQTKAWEDLSSGNVGIFINPFTIRNPFMRTKQNILEAEFSVFPAPPQKDGAYHMSAENSCYKWLVVNSNFDHPEAAIKGQNLWYELWQGDQAEFYHGTNLSDKYAQSGENFKLYLPFWFDPPLKNLHQGEVFPDAWGNRDRDSIVSPETRKQYDRSLRYFDEGETDLYTGWSNIHMFEMAFPLLKQIYGAPDNILFDQYAGPQTELIANRKPLTDQVRLEWLIKFIVGNADVDSDFDTYVKEWNSVGGKEILEEVNKWYSQR